MHREEHQPALAKLFHASMQEENLGVPTNGTSQQQFAKKK